MVKLLAIYSALFLTACEPYVVAEYGKVATYIKCVFDGKTYEFRDAKYAYHSTGMLEIVSQNGKGFVFVASACVVEAVPDA